MITVFLACKHQNFFLAVESLLLESKIKIKGSSNKCLQAAQDFANNSCDVVLLDAQWGGDEFTSRTILQELKLRTPLAKVILVSTFYEQHIADRCRQNKLIKGYIYCSRNTILPIVNCITTVANGGQYISNLH